MYIFLSLFRSVPYFIGISVHISSFILMSAGDREFVSRILMSSSPTIFSKFFVFVMPVCFFIYKQLCGYTKKKKKSSLNYTKRFSFCFLSFSFFVSFFFFLVIYFAVVLHRVMLFLLNLACLNSWYKVSGPWFALI